MKSKLRNVACVFALLLFSLSQQASTIEAMATCAGKTPCRACKNCSKCKFCNAKGGTCGICKKRP
jgi:hypothetical protein